MKLHLASIRTCWFGITHCNFSIKKGYHTTILFSLVASYVCTLECRFAYNSSSVGSKKLVPHSLIRLPMCVYIHAYNQQDKHFPHPCPVYAMKQKSANVILVMFPQKMPGCRLLFVVHNDSLETTVWKRQFGSKEAHAQNGMALLGHRNGQMFSSWTFFHIATIPAVMIQEAYDTPTQCMLVAIAKGSWTYS